jgi:hypothetical protein
VPNVLGTGFDIDGLIEIRAAEDDARIRQGRPQSHQDFLARMQTHPGGTNRILQCSLVQHGKPDYRPMLMSAKGTTGR